MGRWQGGLDPIQRTLEVLRLREGVWAIAGTWMGGDAARVEPFDAVALDLDLLWRDEAGPPAP